MREIERGEEKKKADEVAVFVEGLYVNKKVWLFPLTIRPPKTAIFAPLSARNDFSQARAKVEFPREGKILDLALEASDEGFSAPLDADATHRFIVYFSASHQGEAKRVKIQLENE